MDPDTKIIDLLTEEVELLRKHILEAEGLLKACYPYIERHYYESRPTTGVAAKRIMDAIKVFTEE